MTTNLCTNELSPKHINQTILHRLTEGGHKVGEKKFPEFSRLFQSHNTFPQVITTKMYVTSHNDMIIAESDAVMQLTTPDA